MIGVRAATRMLSARALIGVAGLACAGAIGPATAAALPAEAIRYVERPEAGALKDSGRELATAGQAYYGIDINSRMDINVDASKLQALLVETAGKSATNVRAAKLHARVGLLREAADSLGAEMKNVQALLQLWESADAPAFRAKLRESAGARFKILDTLYRARRQRLEESGMRSDDAVRAAKTAFNQVLMAGPKIEFGYDWNALGELFREELKFAEADLRAIQPDLGLRIEILAHLIPGGGRGVAVYLPRYNSEETGAETRYEKLKFAPSENEDELYKQFEAAARQIGEANSAGEAMVKLLENEYRSLRAALGEVTAAAEEAFAQSRDSLKRLQQWGDAARRKAWLESVKTDLESTGQGKEVRKLWLDLEKSLGEIQEDVDALEAYANLNKSLAGKTAPEAMDTLLKAIDGIRGANAKTAGIRVLNAGLWQERIGKVDEFLNAVQAMQPAVRERLKQAGGPYADLLAARDSLRTFADTIEDSAVAVSRWIAEVVFLLPAHRTAAELPSPEGQQQLPVLDSSQLNTSVDLLRARVARSVGDTLRIEYRFYQGEESLPAGWVDTFSLQSYGWQSEVLASLAFAKQDADETWKPTAAMSWILYRNSWPLAGESGLGAAGQVRWFSGAGITAMPLNSSETQDVELGLAATLAFLNNRVLLGYGANLQAPENEGFWFLSIRLFTFPGLSGTLGGVPTR